MQKTTIIIAVLGIFIFKLCCPSIGTSTNRRASRLQLPSPLTGPESLAFNGLGEGPFTGVSDGRIFKFIGAGVSAGFVEFAHSSPNRNKTICDGIADFSALQETCGRPLGLGFSNQTGELFIADAYHGLVKVPYNGGDPTPVVSDIHCRPFRFLDALDIDPETGVVYFTEASSRFQIKDMEALLTSGDSSGSLMSYDPRTGQTRVLLRNLALASGVAVSRNSSFVLVSEYLANRVQRFWLRGPRENSSELFLQLAGRPDNIKRNARGEFWISVNGPLGPPPPRRTAYLPLGVRVNELGLVLQIVPLTQIYGNEAASEVQEFNGALYSGSLRASYASIVSP